MNDERKKEYWELFKKYILQDDYNEQDDISATWNRAKVITYLNEYELLRSPIDQHLDTHLQLIGTKKSRAYFFNFNDSYYKIAIDFEKLENFLINKL